MEYMEGFSLQDMINNVGCLNEDILKPILLKVVDCLTDYGVKYGDDYKEFCPCKIVFDKRGNLKVINS
jgi:ferredoxin-thioredoxin reductase catalytic subunit